MIRVKSAELSKGRNRGSRIAGRNLPRKTSGSGEKMDGPEPEGRHLEGQKIPSNPPDGGIEAPTERSPCEIETHPQNG